MSSGLRLPKELRVLEFGVKNSELGICKPPQMSVKKKNVIFVIVIAKVKDFEESVGQKTS